MPDPLLYVQALLAAAGVSLFTTLVVVRIKPPATSLRIQMGSLLGFLFGLIAGCVVLRIGIRWPPANGLDRLLGIVIPAATVFELLTSANPTGGYARIVRLLLAFATARILLHGSVYLREGAEGWSTLQAITVWIVSGVAVVLSRKTLIALAQSPGGVSVGIALGLAIVCSGLTISLAGYLQGGAAALLFGTALCGAALATNRLDNGKLPNALLGMGVTGLFSFLVVGRFFGALDSSTSLALFGAPLLCWCSEVFNSPQRPLSSGAVTLIRLAVVACPLLVILYLAKLTFERDMLPLL